MAEQSDMHMGSSADMEILYKAYGQVKDLVPEISYLCKHDSLPQFGKCGFVAYDEKLKTDYYLRLEMGDGQGTVHMAKETVMPLVFEETKERVMARFHDPKGSKDQMEVLEGLIVPFKISKDVVFKLTRKGSIPKQVRMMMYSTFECHLKAQRLMDERYPPEDD
jgi:hypothetical protein